MEMISSLTCTQLCAVGGEFSVQVRVNTRLQSIIFLLFPDEVMGFLTELMLAALLWPWGRSASNKNEY
jgi:hypothetical protein